MSYLKDFKTHITNHDYPGFLKLWEEYCSGDELDGEEVCAILEAVKRSDIADPFGRHVERILPLWEQMPQDHLSHEVLRLIVDIASTNSDTLAMLVTEYLKKQYSHEKNFSEKIRLIGFKGKEKLQGSISNYELLSHMQVGNYVFHAGGWGVGEILDVSLVREQLTLEFDYVSGKKEISFSTAFKTLVPLSKDHFLALRFGTADELEKRARENPVAIIHMLLKDLGPKTALEIKEELCDLVIPAAEWSRWWQTTRSKLKKDTLISTPEDLREPFKLRKQELAHEDRFKQTLEQKLDVNTLIQTIYTFLRDFPETLKNAEFKSLLISKIQDPLAHKDLSSVHKLQLLFLSQDLNQSKEEAEVSLLIKQCTSIQNLIELIDVQTFKKRLLVETRKLRSEWKDIFLDLLFKAEQGSLKDYILTELLAAKAEEEVRKKLQDLYTHPASHPDAFMWYFQKLQTQKTLPFSDTPGKIRFFEGLLILLSAIEHKADERDQVKKIHTLIADGRFALVRQIMQSASIEEVKEIILLASKCHSFSDHDQKIFYSLAEVVYPSLAKSKKKQESLSAEENAIIWTSQIGFDKLRNNMQRIATVETIENAKEIEVARSHGDLRENAEFKAALEKRSRLQSELKLLSEQMKHARVITKQDISTKEAGIGTIVECVNKKGDSITYTILGPWDADPDKNILSFQSKLAQAMKGKGEGATFALQGDELTIVSIRSFL